jgi:CYTH domain-containing protein/CHAD domain-containing protein
LAAEIERKFLVTEPRGEIAGHEGVQIDQGYLAITESVEVRLRRAATATRLTVKDGHGDVREEVEVEVDPQAFEALWPLTEGRRLKKTRRNVPLGKGLTAEIDSFEGELQGLILAEVEFDSEAVEHDFDPPAWFGEELTGNQRYAGQRLATDGALKTDRLSSPDRLKRKESVADGTRRIACGRVDKALERLKEIGADYDAAVHGVRKDLKKLRAVLRLLRDGLDKDFYRAQNKRFRDAGRLLSDVRDAQVKLATLDALEARYEPEMPEQPSSLLRGMLEGERRQATEKAGGEPRTRMLEAKEMIAGGAGDLADWPLEGHGWRLLEPGLSRSYREARKAMRHARSSRAAKDVHEWRKRTKDLWYHLRLLRGTWKPVIGEFAGQAHELADLLGDHHDLTVLAQDLEARQGIRERERISELIERRQGELLNMALELGSRLFAEKPKAFRRRLRAYWRAWR